MSLKPAALALLVAAPAHARAQTLPGDAPPSAAPSAEYWLRLYPLQPYSAYWRMTVEVDDLAKGVAKAQSALAKAGAEATVPAANMAGSGKTQQLSYRVSVKSADKALKSLRKLGAVASLTQTPGLDPAILAEARDKRAKLDREAAAHKEALAKLPAHSALAAELGRHLALVERVHSEAAGRILLNLELREGK